MGDGDAFSSIEQRVGELRRESRARPDDDELRRELVRALVRHGGQLVDAKKRDDAYQLYVEAEQEATVLTERRPDDVAARRARGSIESMLGLIEDQRGDAEAAGRWRMANVASRRAIAAATEDAPDHHARDAVALASALTVLGTHERAVGASTGAALTDEAVDLVTAVVAGPHANVGARRVLAKALNARARIRLEAGDRDGALADHLERVAVLRVVDDDPEATDDDRLEWARALRDVAQHLFGKGDVVAAIEAAEAAVEITDQLAARANPTATNVLFQQGLALATLGQMRCEGGDLAGARHAFARANAVTATVARRDERRGTALKALVVPPQARLAFKARDLGASLRIFAAGVGHVRRMMRGAEERMTATKRASLYRLFFGRTDPSWWVIVRGTGAMLGSALTKALGPHLRRLVARTRIRVRAAAVRDR